MIVTLPKHRGKTAEAVVIKHPEYVMWVLDHPAPRVPMQRLQREFLRLIRLLDTAPWTESCLCGSTACGATLRVVGGVVAGLRLHCDECGAHPSEAPVSRYMDAATRGRTWTDCREIVRAFLRLKGLRPRARAEKYFKGLEGS